MHWSLRHPSALRGAVCRFQQNVDLKRKLASEQTSNMFLCVVIPPSTSRWCFVASLTHDSHPVDKGGITPVLHPAPLKDEETHQNGTEGDMKVNRTF